MDVFDDVDDNTKVKLVSIWKEMNSDEKDHFINQISLALSVWGSDEIGKKLVVEIIRALVLNGSLTLSDFSLYLDSVLQAKSIVPADRLPKIKRASVILEGYRIKNGLPSEPHKEYGI